MLASSRKNRLSLSLFAYVALVFTLTVCVDAHIHQRNHANLNRIIKKRLPATEDASNLSVLFGPVVGAGAAPTDSTASSDSASATSTAVSTSQSSSASSISSTAPASSLSSSLSSSQSSAVTTLSASSTTSVSSTTQSSLSTSTTPSPTTANPTSEAINLTSPPSSPPETSKPVVTIIHSVDPSSQTASVSPQVQASATKPKSTTVTILIIVGASVAGLVILWTVFRKWKFGRSSKFDERLQPIDWRPTGVDEDLPGSHRRLSGASSLRSGSGHPASAHGHGGSDHGHNSPSSYTLPDHDFTAGPAHLAPIGGYADLARGPSPQPQMKEMGGVSNHPHPTYDVGLPLHHQGYNSQNAYGSGRL